MISDNYDLFSALSENEGAEESGSGDFLPLAARMRPLTIGEYIGQEHILAPGKPLRKAIDLGICMPRV